MEANNDLLRAELSYQATSQMAVHNPLGIISAFSIYNNLVTSGMTCAGFNGGHACDCIIKAGEIIYLNTSCTGSFDLRILLLVNEGA